MQEQILNYVRFNAIEIDKQNNLGGFKIVLPNQKFLIEKTLASVLECEFKNFYKNYKIILNISDMG